MVNVTIDGKAIQVSEGTTVLRAAQSAGIFIPTLCDHPELTPYGGCRLCLVELEGARTLQPSCTLPVSNNMVIHTDTAKVKEARKFVLTLIFSERNHFCPYCQVSGGDCELQNAAYREGMTHWPLQPNWQTNAVDASHPYFVLDNNRCILCRRCVRACGELVGNFTLGFEERGAKSFLVADLGNPLGSSSCISCGTCVQVCPTGALIDRQSAYQGRETQVEHHNTVCVGCSLGCGMDVLTRDNRLVRIESAWGAPVADGVLCKVGRFEPLDEKAERILTPMVKKGGSLKATTWDEALNVVTSHLKPLAGKVNGGVAAIASTRLSAEALFAFKKLFVEGLKSTVVTSVEEGQSTFLQTALAQELKGSYEGKLADLDKADAVLTIGADLIKNHEVAGFFIKRSLPLGTKLVVVDPDENGLDALTDCSLKSKKAADLDIIQGIAAAVSKLGLSKTAAIPSAEKALTTAVEKTGISADAFLKAAEYLASAEHPIFVMGKGLTSKESPATLKALLDLAKMTGASMLSLKGKANSLAASQYGLDKAFVPEGCQAVYVALGDDEPAQRLVQKLEKASFLVVQASYTSQLTAEADVVLPVGIWSENTGHYLNLEGRLQEAIQALTATEEILSNQAVLEELAKRLGVSLAGDWKDELFKRISPVALEEAQA